jgi:hypothetical protein
MTTTPPDRVIQVAASRVSAEPAEPLADHRPGPGAERTFDLPAGCGEIASQRISDKLGCCNDDYRPQAIAHDRTGNRILEIVDADAPLDRPRPNKFGDQFDEAPSQTERGDHADQRGDRPRNLHDIVAIGITSAPPALTANINREHDAEQDRADLGVEIKPAAQRACGKRPIRPPARQWRIRHRRHLYHR